MTGDQARRRDVRTCLIGLLGALTLTGGAFAAVRWPLAGGGRTLAAVFTLGLVQIVLHVRFFLHVTLRKSSRDNLQLILFSALITLLMVGGTLVILANLHHRMM